MEWKNFYKSHEIKLVISVLLVIVVLLLVFQVGEEVGEHREKFAGQLGDNYSRIFEGDDGHNFGMLRSPSTYGASGKVVALGAGTITVADRDNTEKIIRIMPDTLIRQFHNDATTTDIHVNDNIIVIGNPNSNGEIEARLIRIVPQATSTPQS